MLSNFNCFIDSNSSRFYYFICTNIGAATVIAIASISLGCSFGNEWTLLNHVPSSTNLHPAQFTTTHLISTCTQLNPPPPSSLRHLQQYLNQNIARKWAISPNLGRKFKICPFRLKIGTHGILKVLIPNPGLDFWNSDPKINFWANLGPKIQSCLFWLKIGAHSISKMLIPNSDLRFLKFRHQNPFLDNFKSKNSKLSVLPENCVHKVFQGC